MDIRSSEEVVFTPSEAHWAANALMYTAPVPAQKVFDAHMELAHEHCPDLALPPIVLDTRPNLTIVGAAPKDPFEGLFRRNDHILASIRSRRLYQATLPKFTVDGVEQHVIAVPLDRQEKHDLLIKAAQDFNLAATTLQRLAEPEDPTDDAYPGTSLMSVEKRQAMEKDWKESLEEIRRNEAKDAERRRRILPGVIWALHQDLIKDLS